MISDNRRLVELHDDKELGLLGTKRLNATRERGGVSAGYTNAYKVPQKFNECSVTANVSRQKCFNLPNYHERCFKCYLFAILRKTVRETNMEMQINGDRLCFIK